MRHLKKMRLLTIAILLLFFTACGGGNSSDSSNTPPNPTTPNPPIVTPNDPDVNDPDADDPDADDPGATDPDADDPGATDPDLVDPGAANPKPIGPANPDLGAGGLGSNSSSTAPPELKAFVGADGYERRIITFTASGPWNASVEGCEVVPPSGPAGVNTVVVSCPPNNSGVNRTFELTIIVTDGEEIVIPFIQKPNPAPQKSDFTEINRMEAIHSRVYDINNNNTIIMNINEDSGEEKAFLVNGGSYTPIENPDSVGNTSVYGINDNGHILGYYEGGYFLKTEAGYQPLENYNGYLTEYTGINKSGKTTGYYWDSDGYARGFIKNGGSFTEIKHPDAANNCDRPGQCGTFITGINNNDQVTGYYINATGVRHGFVRDGESYIPIEHPDGYNKVINTHVTGINDEGRMSGYFWSADDRYARGFVTDGDRLIEIVHPEATGESHGTYVYGINKSGRIVGWFEGGGKARGFLFYK